MEVAEGRFRSAYTGKVVCRGVGQCIRLPPVTDRSGLRLPKQRQTVVASGHLNRFMVILLLARHRELGLFRVHALEGAGHDVIFPQHKQAALEVIVRGNFDLIVLSYSLSSDTAQELVEIARQKYPDRPVIAISESGWEDTNLRPDATVLAGDGPDGMLDAIARVTRQGFRRVK